MEAIRSSETSVQSTKSTRRHIPEDGILQKTTTFRRLDLSPKCCGLLSSTYKTMDRVQNKPNSSVQHTPSSESFQVYLSDMVKERLRLLARKCICNCCVTCLELRVLLCMLCQFESTKETTSSYGGGGGAKDMLSKQSRTLWIGR
jgi:hypothetical protein